MTYSDIHIQKDRQIDRKIDGGTQNEQTKRQAQRHSLTCKNGQLESARSWKDRERLTDRLSLQTEAGFELNEVSQTDRQTGTHSQSKQLTDSVSSDEMRLLMQAD